MVRNRARNHADRLWILLILSMPAAGFSRFDRIEKAGPVGAVLAPGQRMPEPDPVMDTRVKPAYDTLSVGRRGAPALRFVFYLFLFTGFRFSMNAAMPSERSSSAKVE